MREMVLNHASLTAAGWRDAVEWLRDAAEGMAAVVENGAAAPALRIFRTMDQIRCRDNLTLIQVYSELRRRGKARDHRMSLMERIDRAHFLLDGLGPEVKKQLRGCKSTELPTDEGVPLVLCALTGAIAISVPSEPAWNRDRIPVEFIEQGAHRRVEIDNVARSVHARSVAERHRQRLRSQCSDTAQLWGGRAKLFPSLTFGLDVEDHLAKLDLERSSTLVNRLADLDDTAAAWADDGGATPPWRSEVKRESDSVWNNRRLREKRRFRSADGASCLYELHVQLGGRRRIHLRSDARTREIEIGYIGAHLPTSTRST